MFFPRLCHSVGIILFGGFILHDFFHVLFFAERLSSPEGFIRLFYFITLPAFVILLLSGIWLIVQKPYYFKTEKWLQKKFIIAITIMFILIIGIFPQMKPLALNFEFNSDFSPTNSVYPFLIFAFLIIILFFINLAISLRHRLLSNQ
ncbi:MAG: hypothetical protein Kow0042_06950 [Calditrichia bacterium]